MARGNVNIQQSLEEENAALRQRLIEAEETLAAIKDGHVEALVIGDQIYTLESADAASNRFRGDVLAQINDIVIAVDADRRLTYINPAAEKKYKLSSSEVLGRRAIELFQTRWPVSDSEQEALSSIAQRGFWRGEVVHVLQDGTEFDVEVMSSQLRDLDGTPSGFLGVIRDISERKAADRLLQDAHDQLESRVAERTSELADANHLLQEEMIHRAKVENQRTNLLQRIVTTQEAERSRIARDIHDQLGQRVTALRLQIASLNDHCEESQKLAGKVELLKRTALRLDSEVSFLAWELRPASLDDLGLPEAARAFVEEWSHNYKVSTDFSLRGFSDRRLPPESETQLYRIMQESLNNIAKHAGATTVSVLLEWKDDIVGLIVEDNGKGFVDQPTEIDRMEASKSLGILGMHERAALVGGLLEIESIEGSGTTVYVRLPAK
ncbi:MAG: PAS domain S-box protein [Pyrinomonadaceae bacterium]